jgi:hypothetical protein
LVRAWTIQLAQFAKPVGVSVARALRGSFAPNCGSSAQVIGIVAHERVTTALKFGSLSNSDGFFAGIAILMCANAGFSRREPQRQACQIVVRGIPAEHARGIL